MQGIPDASCLKCTSFNARSLVNKLAEFCALLQSNLYDVIFVAETWLSDSVTDGMLTGGLPYHIVRRDRESRGGGILIAIKNHLTFNLCSIDDSIEAISLEFPLLKVNVILGYLPDGNLSSDVQAMCKFFRTSVKKDYSNIIVGDYNQSTINWINAKASLSVHNIFLDCVLELAMRQHVNEPTRLDNILDLVMVDDDRSVFCVNVIEHFGSSDHCMVTFHINSNGMEARPQTQSRGQNVDFEKLRQSLKTVDWEDLFHNVEDAGDLWNIFIATLSRETNNASVIKKCANGNGTKLPKVLRVLLSRKKKLWKIFKKKGDESSKLHYNTCRLKYSNLVKEIEINKERKVISEGNLGALYRFIRKKTGSQRSIPPLMFDDKLHNSGTDKANILNDRFTQNFVIDNEITPPFNVTEFSTDLSEVNFPPSSVLLSLNSFKKSKAIGPDGFSPHFYNEIKFQIFKPLSVIFTVSFKTGMLPSCWKISRVGFLAASLWGQCSGSATFYSLFKRSLCGHC